MTIRTIAYPTLVPVIELEPACFGNLPSPPAPWSTETAAAYWQGCIAQAGLGHLAPIRPGSWHVTVASLIEPSDIQAVLTGFHERFEDLPDDELPLALNGGCALMDGENVVFEPQCCGDLADIANWEDAAAHRTAGRKQLWTGHPWLEARFAEGWLYLGATNDHTSPLEEVRVHPEALADSIEAAREIQKAFAERLMPALLALGVSDADMDTIAAALAGVAS